MTTKTNRRVSVFVRVRPLTAEEQMDGTTIKELEGLTLTNDMNHAVALETSTICIDGFTGVFGQKAKNRYVFDRCFDHQRLLSTILRGGTTSLFCYGYTGGGKTYTAIGGYGGQEEKGLFFMAAERLLQDLKVIVEKEQSGNNNNNNTPKEEKLFLQATACEIYLDQVYDLIGPEKRACKIRMDGDGQLVVHGEVTTKELDGINEDCRHGNHATLVTLAPGLNSISIHHPDDLEALSQTCIAQRVCGTSTTNKTSSRSHAILRLEVVSNAINRTRDALQLRQAEIPALKNARDNCMVFREKRQIMDRIQTAEADVQKMILEIQNLQANGPTALGGSMLLVDLAGADYDHRGGAAQKESTAINQSLLALKECFRSIASTATTPCSSVTKQQQQQQQPHRPPFRSSKLTRILEDSLAPRETSRRRNKESNCVMVVNVSPASNLKHGTINALRYGQLFAGGSSRNKNGSSGKSSSSSRRDDTSAGGASKKESRIAKIRKQAKENLLYQQQSNDPNNVDPEIWKQEIREIYNTHVVPKKTKEEVDEILSKFSGREQMLLERVKAKYIPFQILQ